MLYDESLADRVRAVLSDVEGIDEQRMFGGLAFMHRGNMTCGVLKNDLIVRMSPEAAEQALTALEAEPMLFTGRPMKGFVSVPAKGVTNLADVRKWVARALDFTNLLPPKSKSPARRAPGRSGAGARR